MKRSMISFIVAAAAAVCIALIPAGCNSDGTISDDVIQGLEGSGDSTSQGLASLFRVRNAWHKYKEKFSPLDEYHLGRATGAQIIAQYGLVNDPAATRYVNLVGQTLAEFSTKPSTYSGYHFAILNSDDVNAFAVPGAFIFVTRGLLRCAETEDELAAVLAHEIGHVQREHALLAINEGRFKNFVAVGVTEGAKTAAGAEYRQQVGQVLGDMSADVLKKLKDGYSRTQESEADNDGVAILKRTGYDPSAMASLLTKMEKRLKPGAHDFSSTHPKTSERIASIKSAIGGAAPQPANAARQARFNAALAGAR